MRNITVTWQDLNWIDEEDAEPEYKGGFIVNGIVYKELDSSLSINTSLGISSFVEDTGMNRDQIISLIEFARTDLDDMIDCALCSSWLREDSYGNWIDENGSACSNANTLWQNNTHIHRPEKMWYEILVDTLEEYGAYEDNNGSWYSDFNTIDYRNGTERQYAVHIDWEITPEEFALIDDEIERRRVNRMRLMEVV